MLEPFRAENIEDAFKRIDKTTFVDELVDSISRLKVYSAVLKRSIARESCMTSMYMKESLHSSRMETTRTSLQNSLEKAALDDDSDKDVNEVRNYFAATRYGREYLMRTGVFSEEMLLEMHRILLSGNVYRTTESIGCYRTEQNFIQNVNSKEITFVPPEAKQVKPLMDNLISFMNNPASGERNLVNAAVIHEQFETIHPFRRRKRSRRPHAYPAIPFQSPRDRNALAFLERGHRKGKIPLLQDAERRSHEWRLERMDKVFPRNCRPSVRQVRGKHPENRGTLRFMP